VIPGDGTNSREPQAATPSSRSGPVASEERFRHAGEIAWRYSGTPVTHPHKHILTCGFDLDPRFSAVPQGVRDEISDRTLDRDAPSLDDEAVVHPALLDMLPRISELIDDRADQCGHDDELDGFTVVTRPEVGEHVSDHCLHLRQIAENGHPIHLGEFFSAQPQAGDR
jgi:hypothetical protein